MGWYDFFARFYDRSLEPLYADARRAAAEALFLQPDSVVLDVPCGTGQSFDGIASGLTGGGLLIGVDASAGMLDRARTRVTERSLVNVCVGDSNVHDLTVERLSEIAGRTVRVDRIHVFLGFTAFDRWTDAFDRLWNLLEPGGRFVIVDVFAEAPGFQGRMVNLVARADIRRRVWEPLERVSVEFQRRELPSVPKHGGTLVLASGRRS